MLIQSTGMLALIMAQAAKTLPLVLDVPAGNVPRPARSLSEARRLAALSPAMVSFACDARVLIETITGNAIHPGDDLLAAANNISSPPCDAAVREIIIGQLKENAP